MKTVNVAKEKDQVDDGLKKPPKNEATKWFIKFGISFCNARTAGDLFKTAFEILYSQGGKSCNSGEWKVWNKELINSEKLDWNEKFFHLEEVEKAMAELDITRSIVCKMIRQATIPNYKGYSQGLPFIRNEFLDAVKSFFQPSLRWSAKEKYFKYLLRARRKNEKFGEYFSGAVKAILLSKLIEACAHDKNDSSSGSFYFTCCRACYLVLEKTRKDKIYCDHQCADRQARRVARTNKKPIK